MEITEEELDKRLREAKYQGEWAGILRMNSQIYWEALKYTKDNRACIVQAAEDAKRDLDFLDPENPVMKAATEYWEKKKEANNG